MPYNDSISEFYDKLGPFFEFKKEKANKRVNGDSAQSKLNGNNQLTTKDANFSSSSDSTTESDDDFSDTVDSLSVSTKRSIDARSFFYYLNKL